MAEIVYDFVELESNDSFELLGEAFQATFTPHVLLFDNPLIKGEIIKAAPEEGLWIRKWKLTTFSKIRLRRSAAPVDYPGKFQSCLFCKSCHL